MKNHLTICIIALTLLAGCNKKDVTEYPLNDSPAGNNSSLPWLFTGPTGRTWMSWVEKTDTIYAMKFSEARADHWSKPVTIANGSNWFVNWADYPMMVTNDSGKFVAHILEKSGPGKFSYDIRVFTSTDDGKTWNNSFLLNDDNLEAEHGFVSMVPWNGNVFFTWLDGRQTAGLNSSQENHEGHHGSMSLRAGVRTYQGEKIAEWLVDDRTCDCCQTTAAIFDNTPVVVYRDRSDSEIRDMATSRLENGQWTKPLVVSNDGWEIKGCPVNGPRMAYSGNKTVTVWFTAAQDQPAVYAAISGDGGKSFKERIRIDDGKPNGRVDVTAAGNKFFISWLEDSQIRVKQIDEDGNTGKSFLIANTSAARNSGFPQLTSTSSQDILVAWTDTEKQKIETKVIKF